MANGTNTLSAKERVLALDILRNNANRLKCYGTVTKEKQAKGIYILPCLANENKSGQPTGRNSASDFQGTENYLASISVKRKETKPEFRLIGNKLP